MAEVQNISVITERSAGWCWSGGLARPGLPSRDLSHFPMLSVLLEAVGSAFISGSPCNPAAPLSRLPAAPCTPPHTVLLGPSQAARRLTWTPFPVWGVLLAGKQEDVEGVLGLAPDVVGSAALGQAPSWALGVCSLHQEKVMVWRILGSRWRLSHWTDWETVSH